MQQLSSCPNCGAQIDNNLKFCSNCGKELPTTPECPKTYLVESILVTLFCCLPFGIVGIINASNVSSNFSAGRYKEAEQCSRNALKFIKISIGLGVAFFIIYFLIVLIAALAA